MSNSNVAVQLIDSVLPHPNADRLDTVEVSGYTLVVQKGSFKVGDLCVYFPPDNLIPESVATALGVVAYLKHAVYPGDSGVSKCRIGAARLRGVSSFGFAIKCAEGEVGEDRNEAYQVKRYEPPIKAQQGQQSRNQHPKLFRYTDIENVQRHSYLIPEGTPVIYTEKIHGANCRVGVLDGEIVAGSHNVQIASGSDSIYWSPLPVCQALLNDAKEDGLDLIIYGEVFGPGVQDLHYDAEGVQFRCFDISANGNYLPALVVMNLCKVYGIPMVPVLGTGPFSREKLAELTDGKSTLAGHIREGVVVKALEESTPRRILKSVSVDYLSRN